ncbi:serine/threonine-protein kinase BLUS1-like [Capsicum galapagoense]
MLIRLAYEASVYDSEKINVEEDIEEDSNEEEAGSSSSAFLAPKGIAKWGAAPEVFGRENDEGVGPKSDIWLLGIMALELAYGELPVSTREDLDRLIKKLRKERRFPRSLENMLIVNNREVTFKKAMNLFKRKEEVFSEMFESTVRKCLAKKPKKRPTAAQLLDSYTTFFTQKDMERFERFVLNAENNPVPTTN